MLVWGCCSASRLLPRPGTHSTSRQQGDGSVLPGLGASGATSRRPPWQRGVRGVGDRQWRRQRSAGSLAEHFPGRRAATHGEPGRGVGQVG